MIRERGYRINVSAYGTKWSCWGELLLLRMDGWHKSPAHWASPRFAHFDALEFG